MRGEGRGKEDLGSKDGAPFERIVKSFGPNSRVWHNISFTDHIDIVLDHMKAFECNRNQGKQASSSARAEFRREDVEIIVKKMPDLIEWQKSLGYRI